MLKSLFLFSDLAAFFSTSGKAWIISKLEYMELSFFVLQLPIMQKNRQIYLPFLMLEVF